MEEKKYNTLAEVLAVYDVAGLRFEYHDYVAALCSMPDGERAKPESLHERTAFKLQPNDSDHTFGGYFGPQVTMADLQGNPVEAGRMITKALLEVSLEGLGNKGVTSIFPCGIETLLTKEEAAKAIDMGNFYAVPADNRDLNYDKYFKEGDTKRATIEEFNSDNTKRLNLEETKEKIAELTYIKNELAGIPNLV